MVKAIRISALNVELEETNMNQVLARFGGNFGTQGDAGDSLEWLCLSGHERDGPFDLWLKSGEMDAGTVGSFQWGACATKGDLMRDAGRCPKPIR
jgi:hypothetical protein